MKSITSIRPRAAEPHPFTPLSGLLLVVASSCHMQSFSTAMDAGDAAQSGGEQGQEESGHDARAASSTSRDAAREATPSPGGVLVSGDLTFGAVDCGATAAARTLMVKNTGDKPFTVTAGLTNGAASAFAFALSSASVAAHGEATITVTPKPIPATSPVPGMYTDTLAVSTDAVGDSPHLIAASETAQGAILAFDTQAIPFGEVPVSSAQSSTFHLMNTGNQPATVTLSLGASGSSSFSVSQGSMTVSNGDNLTADATFSPTSTGMQSSTVVVAPAAGTVLCAPLPAPLALTGIGENGGLAVSENAITFGPTTCGTTAKAATLMLTNTGNAPLTWTATLANTSPSPYTLSPRATGSLAAAASVTLTVTPGAIPKQSSVQANFYADTLTFNTDVVGDEPHVVALNQTASGAILAFNPSSVSFGDVPVNTTGTAHFQVVNTGNTAAHATLSSSSPSFTVTPSASTSIGAAAQVNFTGTFAPGTSTTATNGTFAIASTDPLCAPLPAALPVTGTGTNGVVAFAPGALTFGNQGTTGFTACGTAAPAQQVTFTNAGNQSYTITPTLELGASSPYTFTMAPATGVVAAGGMVVVTVTPKPIPQASAVPGAYGDSLSVATTAIGDAGPHVIALTQSAYGAILTGAPSSVAFPATPIGEQSTSPLGITNSGNAAATLVWTAISSPVFTFDQNVTAPPGGVMTSPVAAFTPTAAQAYTGTATLGVTAGTILCQPIPAAGMSLSGTGTTGSTVSVTPAQVNFNMVPCSTSGGSDTVTIKNNGTASITWSATLPTGSNFTLGTPSSGTLASGTSATVTVTSNVIPVAAATTTAANGFGSQLTVTTNAIDDTPHVVPILETASGAILSFSPTSLNLPIADDGSPVSYQVQNSGNLPASVTMTLNNMGPAVLTLDAPTSGMVSSGTPLQGAVTEGLASPPSSNATVSLAVATGTVLCQPAPAPMTVVAN